jgi:hypothetical protein
MDIVLAIRKTPGDGYDRWFKIQDIAFRTGKESDGYYMWFDKREKYMVMVSIVGTNFFLLQNQRLYSLRTSRNLRIRALCLKSVN